MATLHVRNVPDDVYGLLQQQAHTNRRSISAETVTLLVEALQTRSARAGAAEILAELRNSRQCYSPPPGAPTSLDLLREDRAR